MSNWAKETTAPAERQWEEFYRNRFQHDKRVRTTHGVNCTGSCSWEVFVKDGIVTWELQATDYPQLEDGLPPYEPRGCQRGISFSWYLYSPIRVKYPYVRGASARPLARGARNACRPRRRLAVDHGRPGEAGRFQQARGKGGFRRVSWDEALEIIAASVVHTVKDYGPDRVIGFSPIPAMSQVSYAAGSRFLTPVGRRCDELLRLVLRSAARQPGDLGRANRRARVGRLVQQPLHRRDGRQPQYDPHARHPFHLGGAPRRAPSSPSSRPISRRSPSTPTTGFPFTPGQDTAFWMAVNHVLLKEFYVERQVPYFVDYLKQYTDMPFLVQLGRMLARGRAAGPLPARQPDRRLRATRRTATGNCWSGTNAAASPRMPQGHDRLPLGATQRTPGKWNLECATRSPAKTWTPSCPSSTITTTMRVQFDDFATGRTLSRTVPVRYVETEEGRVPVTTVFDLIMAQFGVDARPGDGEYPQDYDEDQLYTPDGRRSTPASTATRCSSSPASGPTMPKRHTARTWSSSARAPTTGTTTTCSTAPQSSP